MKPIRLNKKDKRKRPKRNRKENRKKKKKERRGKLRNAKKNKLRTRSVNVKHKKIRHASDRCGLMFSQRIRMNLDRWSKQNVNKNNMATDHHHNRHLPQQRPHQTHHRVEWIAAR